MSRSTPANEFARRDLEDLFGALLDTGHTLEDSLEFMQWLGTEESDAQMRIAMVRG